MKAASGTGMGVAGVMESGYQKLSPYTGAYFDKKTRI